MSLALLPYVGCGCCVCPAPRLLSRRRSAGGSKVGFRPYISSGGALSSHIYLAASQSGSVVGYTPPGEGECLSDFTSTLTAGGSMTTDRHTGEITGEMTGTSEGVYSDPCGGTDYSSSCSTPYFYEACALGVAVFEVDPNSGAGFITLPGASGELTLTMSVEFTDAMLFDDHPVPEFEGDLVESSYIQPFAHYFFNGVTLGRSAAEYRFAFPVPGNGVCYRIEWNERAQALKPDGTYDSASPPVYTPRSYQWDHAVPDDYDPDDMATWPKTPVYLLDIPMTNSAVQIVDSGGFSAVLEDPDVETDLDRVAYSCERCT